MSNPGFEVEGRAPIVVLGMGNVLRRDAGMDIRALKCLQEQYVLSAGVRPVDGGNLGLELLRYLEDTDRVLVLDVTPRAMPTAVG